jgi:hypothetical protein
LPQFFTFMQTRTWSPLSKVNRAGNLRGFVIQILGGVLLNSDVLKPRPFGRPPLNRRRRIISVEAAERRSRMEELTAPIVRWAERRTDWLVLRSSAVWRHAARKHELNMWLRVDGTLRNARHGTNRGNHLGLRAKCSRNKSSRCLKIFQPLRFDHVSVSRAGTQARSGKATVHIHGTGRRWPTWPGLCRGYRILQIPLTSIIAILYGHTNFTRRPVWMKARDQKRNFATNCTSRGLLLAEMMRPNAPGLMMFPLASRLPPEDMTALRSLMGLARLT